MIESKREPYFYKWIPKMSKHTNASIRTLLGERGFIEDKSAADKGSEGAELSFWRRGDDTVRLHEYENREPQLFIHAVDGPELVNPENDLGYRNLEIQNDGSRDE